VVFGDTSLLLMARDKPTESEEFLQISGVGEAKLERFGDEFMNAIAQHSITGT
jgi:ATP-dependent DNA helicase RecQ